jgi:DNA-binding MarR family transcriptional regulator
MTKSGAEEALQPADAALPRDVPLQIDLGVMASGLGFLMKVGHLVAAERNTRHFREAGLAPSCFTILKCLQCNPGLRQGHLAAALRIKPAMMTKLVRGFEAEGWIRRQIPDGDRRTVNLFLTDAGEARLADADTHFDRAMQAEECDLSAVEVAELRRLLWKLIGVTPKRTLQLPG